MDPEALAAIGERDLTDEEKKGSRIFFLNFNLFFHKHVIIQIREQ